MTSASSNSTSSPASAVKPQTAPETKQIVLKEIGAKWGKFSEQIQDYTQRGIQDRAGSAAGDQLNRIVDPYSYRDSIVQPKLIMLGTNDRYWPLDALK